MEIGFAQRLALYVPRVHRAALGLLGDEQEAREVAQEALLRAWAARDRFDARRPLYPWLYVIVRNACRDARAARRRRPRVALDSERLPESRGGPLGAVRAAETRERIARAMEALRPEEREIIGLRHFQDLSYAEIAEILGIPRGTVMSRLYRARRALLRSMEEG